MLRSVARHDVMRALHALAPGQAIGSEVSVGAVKGGFAASAVRIGSQEV